LRVCAHQPASRSQSHSDSSTFCSIEFCPKSRDTVLSMKWHALTRLCMSSDSHGQTRPLIIMSLNKLNWRDSNTRNILTPFEKLVNSQWVQRSPTHTVSGEYEQYNLVEPLTPINRCSRCGHGSDCSPRTVYTVSLSESLSQTGTPCLWLFLVTPVSLSDTRSLSDYSRHPECCNRD
jgi:hypothetical protein